MESVSIQLSKTDPLFLRNLCRPSLSPNDFLRPLSAQDWDLWLGSILRRVRRAKHVTFDWFGEMNYFQKWTFARYRFPFLRTLRIRGIRDESGQYHSLVPYDFGIPDGDPGFELLHLTNIQFEPEGPKRTSGPLIAQAGRPRHGGQAASPRPNTSWKLKLVDCKAVEGHTVGWIGVVEACIIFDDGQFHHLIFNTFRISGDTLRSLELADREPPPRNQ